jgi:hypothetical protein
MFDESGWHNNSRRPLAKSVTTADSSRTDWVSDSDKTNPATTQVGADYRAPAGRVNGNEVFRRSIDGSLDYDYAKHKVLDCLKKQKDLCPLTDLEQLILSVYFPYNFNYIDFAVADKMRTIQLRLAPHEVMQVCQLVGAHLAEEIAYIHSVEG